MDINFLLTLNQGGEQSVRLAWGKVQEGAAMATLLKMLPNSTLHEVKFWYAIHAHIHNYYLLVCIAPSITSPLQSSSLYLTFIMQVGLMATSPPAGYGQKAHETTQYNNGPSKEAGESVSLSPQQPHAEFTYIDPSANLSSPSSPPSPSLILPPMGASPDGIICHLIKGVPRTLALDLARLSALDASRRYLPRLVPQGDRDFSPTAGQEGETQVYSTLASDHRQGGTLGMMNSLGAHGFKLLSEVLTKVSLESTPIATAQVISRSCSSLSRSGLGSEISEDPMDETSGGSSEAEVTSGLGGCISGGGVGTCGGQRMFPLTSSPTSAMVGSTDGSMNAPTEINGEGLWRSEGGSGLDPDPVIRSADPAGPLTDPNPVGGGGMGGLDEDHICELSSLLALASPDFAIVIPSGGARGGQLDRDLQGRPEDCLKPAATRSQPPMMVPASGSLSVPHEIRGTATKTISLIPAARLESDVGGDTCALVDVLVREVVEIKTTCPFVTRGGRVPGGRGGGSERRAASGSKKKKKKGGKGGGGCKLEWMVSDRGPRRHVSPL